MSRGMTFDSELKEQIANLSSIVDSKGYVEARGSSIGSVKSKQSSHKNSFSSMRPISINDVASSKNHELVETPVKYKGI